MKTTQSFEFKLSEIDKYKEFLKENGFIHFKRFFTIEKAHAIADELQKTFHVAQEQNNLNESQYVVKGYGESKQHSSKLTSVILLYFILFLY